MKRREFLAAAAAPLFAADKSILVHEHIMVDFIGADKIGPGRYDASDVLQKARPKLQEIIKLGCVRLQECTPLFLGRDPALMQRISGETGLEIWTNTGIYGAADYKYVPEFAKSETAQQLARRFIKEFEDGIDGVKPRFIKTGVNQGPLPALDRKLVQAAAITSRETGLTIASHTGNGIAALEQLEIVTTERVNPSRFVWVHAQTEKDHSYHRKVARAGAWVEFDGIGARSAEWHLECVQFMAENNLLGKTLLSQDSGWYRVGEPDGGNYRPYSYLYTDFLPRLNRAWIPQLMYDNPVKAFG